MRFEMKVFLISGLLVLLSIANASAGIFSEDCDKMHDLVSSFTANLITVDTSAMNLAIALEKSGGQPDLKVYDEGTRGISDAIDTLNNKINKTCK